MKSLKYVISLMLAAIILTACEPGANIDPVRPYDPGPDLEPPTVIITSPLEGFEIKVRDEFATVVIRGEIRDDIELESVVMSLNGVAFKTFTSDDFTDFRRFVLNFTHTQIPDGTHILTVTARDKSGKTTSKSVNFEKVPPYRPIYDGEIFYMPFEGSFTDLISEHNATVVGSPGFTNDGKVGRAFAGAEGSYLTFPTQDQVLGINMLNEEFSATFWYKVNPVPNRAGILSITPAGGSRNFGFRFIREARGATGQFFNFNVGSVDADGNPADTWCDGGAAATIDATAGEWIFLAFTISRTELAVFINGERVAHNPNFNGIRWDGCTTLSIMSGEPNFTVWNHREDLSLMDELRIFNKALTQEEIQTIMNDALND